MIRHHLASSGAVALSGANLTWVVVVAVIALLALAVAGWLVREVLAASKGTQKMQEISLAVQEGGGGALVIDNGDQGAFFHEAVGYTPANALHGASDNGDFAFESHR